MYSGNVRGRIGDILAMQIRNILLLVLVLVISPAWATTYYLDATLGSDIYNGTSPATPWKTIALTASNILVNKWNWGIGLYGAGGNHKAYYNTIDGGTEGDEGIRIWSNTLGGIDLEGNLIIGRKSTFRFIANMESKKVQVNIAQIAEILKIVNTMMGGALYKMIRKI